MQELPSHFKPKFAFFYHFFTYFFSHKNMQWCFSKGARLTCCRILNCFSRVFFSCAKTFSGFKNCEMLFALMVIKPNFPLCRNNSAFLLKISAWFFWEMS